MSALASGSASILQTIAGLFHPPEQIAGIQQLGSGNVNDTFLVTLADSATRQAFVMQRLNTEVFEQPELVMRNLLRLGDHVEQNSPLNLPNSQAGAGKSRKCYPPWMTMDIGWNIKAILEVNQLHRSSHHKRCD